VVQEAVRANDGNLANGLRAILREAIENNRPEGERRTTSEWTLYNIIDLKFLQGLKVREVAKRLALSEADLYRKQRVAIDNVAESIRDMEEAALEGEPEQSGGGHDG
jgi:DNA-directed RNA polymerase specialized sigma subunit